MAKKKGKKEEDFLYNKLTERVWYDGEWWNVKKVYKPRHKAETPQILVEEDEPGDHMIVIDAGNDTFCPDTKKTRGIVNDLLKAEERLIELRRKLENEWMKLFPHSDAGYEDDEED